MVTSMEYTRIQATLSPLALPRVSLCRYLFLSATRFWWEGFSDGSNGKESACNTDMQEAQVRSLGQEYPLEREMATHSSILAGKFHGQRSLAGYSPWGCKESDMTVRLSTGGMSLTPNSQVQLAQEMSRSLSRL